MNMSMTVASTSTPSPPVSPSANDMDWFAGVAEEELLYYTNNDVDSLWAVIGSFVPPPPRPPFLPEERIATDGLTTCDLCTWALRNDRHSSFSLDGTLEAPGEFGWVLTLIIVSLISAAIGAVIMVTLLHCRRMKSAGGRASCCGVGVEDANPQEPVSPGAVGVAGGVSVIPERPPLELDKLPPYHDVTPTPGHNVWSWLGSRRGGGAAGVVATPLSLPPHRCAMNLPVENHYTHMQTDEALYAELDSQTASYASDLQLQLRGSSTYGGRATTPGDEEEDEYHELDAARLHRRYSGDSQTGTLKERRHNQRLQEPDYEMYENGPSTPLSLSRHQHPSHQHHIQHHHHHHHHLRTGAGSEVNPSYQNTAYTGSDADLDGPFLSSAPSSAYYSDLSSNSANNHQQSAGVTLHTNASSMQTQTQTGTCHQAYTTTEPPYRLAAITETTTPSDYI